MFIVHIVLVSRENNLVGYNLPDSYLGIPLFIFTINITIGNKYYCSVCCFQLYSL